MNNGMNAYSQIYLLNDLIKKKLTSAIMIMTLCFLLQINILRF